MIADEVMAGFGRTGTWFAVDHWDVVPDLITMAKGLTSAYVQLGAVGMRHHIAEHFRDNVFYGGLTYNSHPLGCATALATITVYEEERPPPAGDRAGEGDGRAPSAAGGEASERGRGPQHRPVRARGARPQPRHDGAAGPVQRHVR